LKKNYIRIIIFAIVSVLALTAFEGFSFAPVLAVSSAVKFEAEKAVLTGGAIIGKKYVGASSRAYVVFPRGNVKAKTSFTFKYSKATTMDLTLRYSNGNKVAKAIALYKNNVYFKTLSILPTGSFTKWKTIVRTISFPSGKTVFTLRSSDKTSLVFDYISMFPSKSYSVTLDFETKYQSIIGFGGFGGNDASATFSTQKYVDDVYDDLGASIYRAQVEQSFQATNDGSSVDVINMSSFNRNGMFKQWLDYFKAVKAKGPSKVFLSVWSPPAWMKSNKSVDNGGSLLPEFYQHFAKYCAAYVMAMQQGGVDIYAFSIQNEPNFPEPYPSCVYSPEQYAAVNATVAARFKKEGLNVKLLGPEDIGDVNRISSYVFGMEQAGKLDSLDIIAVHGYGDDGVNPGSDVLFWDSAYALARDFKKPLWMTETSGYKNDWASCLILGENINKALSSGRISAWVWWRISDNMPNRNEMEGLMKNMVPTKKYYVSKNFYKYVRPGAIRYYVKSEYSDLSITAYKHPDSKKLTLVIVNQAAVARNISIGAINGGVTPTQFSSYRTSETENCIDAGIVNSTGVQLPASSITTLQADY